MPIIELPLPYGILLLHAIFWSYLFIGRWPRHLALRRVFLVFGCFALSVLFSAFLGFSRGGDPSLILIEIGALLSQIPAFFLAVWFVRDTRDLTSAIRWLSLCVLAVSVYGIAQYYLGPSVIIPGITYTARVGRSMDFIMGQLINRRVISSYGDPNILSGMLVIVLCGLMGALLGKPLKKHSVSMLLWTGSAIGLGCVTLLYCNSRAGYLGLAFGGACFLLLSPGRVLRWLIPVVFAALWMVPRLETADPIDRLLRISEDDPRRDYLETTMEVVSEHPEGSGLGMYTETVLAMNTTRIIPAGTVWKTYNSTYLHLLSRTGLWGVLSFIGILLFCLRRIWRACRSPHLPVPCRFVSLGFAAGFLAVQFAMVVNPFYQLPGGGTSFWMGLGLAYASSQMVRRGSRRGRRMGWSHVLDSSVMGSL